MDEGSVKVTGSCNGVQPQTSGLGSYIFVAANDGMVGKIGCELSLEGSDYRVSFTPDLQGLKRIRAQACVPIAQDAKCSTVEPWYTFDDAGAVYLSDWVVFHGDAYLSVFGSTPADDLEPR